MMEDVRRKKEENIEGRGKREEGRVFLDSARYIPLLFLTILIYFLIQFLAPCNQDLH